MTLMLRAKDVSVHGSFNSVHRVELVHETAGAWIGRPTSNPDCPELTYPKAAWRLLGVLEKRMLTREERR